MDEREFIQSRSVFKKSPVKDAAVQCQEPPKEEQKEAKEEDSKEQKPQEEAKVPEKKEKDIWPVQNTRSATRASVTRKNERSKE